MASGQTSVEVTDDAISVVAPDRPGVFGKVASVLSLHGLDIRDAMAGSAGPMACNTWHVSAGPSGRIPWDAIRRDVDLALRGRLAVEARLAERAQAYRPRKAWAARPRAPRVSFDNAVSDAATVIEVQAADAIGLLARVTRALADLELDIRRAMVQTLGGRGRRHVLRVRRRRREDHRREPPARDLAGRPPRPRHRRHRRQPASSLDGVLSRFDHDRDALGALLVGEPRYRVDQVWQGLYEHLADPDDLTNLPNALRARLAEQLPMALGAVVEHVSDGADTVKFLWELDGGARIETVLMLYPDRATVCVSTQAGCAMGCGFCATGQAGFTRHLTTGEIVEQVVRASGRARSLGRRVSNVVFMGMGEPLANEAAVWGAIERLHGALHLSARHITVSTVGIVPGIRTLARRPLPVNLAVSLHAANDELRNELVPINRRYPLEQLMDACRDYLQAKGRRLSFEWALIDGVNDRRERRPRARRAVPLAPPRRPRQPHPAEPDAGLADDRDGSRRGPGVPGPARRAPCERDRPPEPGHRHRRRLRSARRWSARRAGQQAARTVGVGLTAAPPPGCTSKWRCGVPRALPVSPR